MIERPLLDVQTHWSPCTLATPASVTAADHDASGCDDHIPPQSRPAEDVASKIVYLPKCQENTLLSVLCSLIWGL